jgi:hypothetical protein
LFWDENVEELLKRRSSTVEDDNPVSPAQTNYNAAPTSQHQLATQAQPQWQSTSNQQQQQQHHIFLPPTSPAVRPQVPIPSPLVNYSVHSPGNIAQNLQPLSQPPSNYSQTGPPSIPMNHTAVQSPGGFLSPAPNYQIQSPANAYGQ